MECYFGGVCHGGTCVFPLDHDVPTLRALKGDDVGCDAGAVSFTRSLAGVDPSRLPLSVPSGHDARSRLARVRRATFRLHLTP